MKRSFSIVVLSTILAASLAGCSLLDPWGHSERIFVGAYAWGFEASDFRKCGSSEKWWVVTNDSRVSEELVETHRALTNETMYEEVYARVRARLSGPGTYGHVGAYSREITVLEVLEMRVLEDGECEAHR